MHCKRICLALAVLAAWAVSPLSGMADMIYLSGNGAASTEKLGEFSGTLAYVSDGAGKATLTVRLTNTSPAANGGFLTGFLVNNPNDQITAITSFTYAPVGPTTIEPYFLLDGLLAGVKASPFGFFDFGASLDESKYNGPGKPQGGIGVAETVEFVFSLQGTGLDGLNASSFASAFSSPHDPTKGPKKDASTETPHFMVARFTGFNDGGSDKVPGEVIDPPEPGEPPVTAPEPSSLLLAALGAGLALSPVARRLRRRTSP